MLSENDSCMCVRSHCLICSQPIDISESELRAFHGNSCDCHLPTFIGTKPIFITEKVTVIFKNSPQMSVNL